MISYPYSFVGVSGTAHSTAHKLGKTVVISKIIGGDEKHKHWLV